MEIRTLGEVKVAIIEARLDSYAAKEVEEVFRDLIESGTKKLLCDFSQTEYISSAGLRVVLTAAKSLKKTNGQIALCCLNEFVHEVFETAGFTKIFNIYDSEEEALKNLK